MPITNTVRRLFAAWDDAERVVAGVTDDEATTPVGQGSSFAWTVGHLANNFDSWINVRFQKLAPHPVIGRTNFRYGGDGVAAGWKEIQRAVREVHTRARGYLESLDEQDLDLVIPYDGSVVELHATGLCLRDALEVAITHHYFHIGEIAAKRGLLGHDVGDFPGRFWSTIERR